MKRAEEKRTGKKWLAGLGLGLFLALFLFTGCFAMRPLVEFVSEPERFRLWVEAQGLWGPVLFVGMVALQVIVAVIPGGPFQVVAGYAFGTLWGSVLCLIGTTLGGTLTFLAVRRWGVRFVEIFMPIEKIQDLPILRDPRKLYFWSFLLMLIPGDPKDAVSYAMGLTTMPLHHWTVICAVARIPAILLSVAGGDALGTQNYVAAAALFVLMLAAMAAGLPVCRGITRKPGSERVYK